MRHHYALVRAVAISALAFFGASCAGTEAGGIPTLPLPPGSHLIVTIAPKLDTLLLGTSRSFSASVVSSTGAAHNIPVDWSTADPSIATVANGTVTAVGPGRTTIVARAGVAADSATLVVSSPAFQLRVTPAAVAATLGDTVDFTAMVVGPSGANVQMQSVTWRLSDSTAATLVGAGALATRTEGEIEVFAQVGSVTASAMVKIVRAPVYSIAIVPNVASLAIGGRIQLKAELRDDRGRLLKGRAISWSSGDPAVAKVNDEGGVIALARGGTGVVATSEGKSASIAINVSAAPAASVTLTLPSGSIAPTGTMQATAVPFDASGTPIVGRPVAWQSSDPTVATINSGGLITALVSGQTVISVICDGKVASQRLIVIALVPASLAVLPGSATILLGASTTLTSEIRDQFGSAMSGPAVTWTSTAPTIATVNAAGRVTALALGIASIRATVGALAASVAVTVQNVPVASVAVSPASAFVEIGKAVSLVVTARDSAGNMLANRPTTYLSSNAGIASVSSVGNVIGVTAGSATITVTVDTKVAVATITITNPPPPPPVPVASVSISIAATTLTVGQSAQAVAVPRDAAGNTLSGRVTTWASSNSAAVTVSANGVATAQGTGAATLTASVQGVNASVAVTAVAPSGAIPVVVWPGQSIQAAVTAAPSGTTFLIKAGVHRRQSVIPKAGDVFRGEPGTVLDGEGVTPYAFQPGRAPYPAGVRLEGLIIEHYAPPLQLGAILAGGHTPAEGTEGWVVADCEVRYNATLGIRIGHRMQVLRTKILHNGQLGIGGIGDGALLEGNEIAYNNEAFVYDMDFEAGGTKFVQSDGVVLRNNFVHHNGGPGLWSDIDNVRTLYEGNRVEDNAREGIVHEISYSAVIRGNTVLRNGLSDPKRRLYLWNAGIAVHASSDVEVYGNTVAGNLNGIVAVQQARGAGARGPYVVQNLYVHDNTITQDQAGRPGDANAAAGIVQDIGDNAVFTSRNNRFARNIYFLGANTASFEWLNGNRTEGQWQAFGHDAFGSFTH